MKFVIALTALSIAFAPEMAMAKMKAGGHQAEPTGAARQIQYLKVLKWCQTKFGGNNPSQVNVYWGSHYGKTTWWCSHY